MKKNILHTLPLILTMSVPLFSFATEFEDGTSGGFGGSVFKDTVPSDYLQLRSVTVCAGSLIDSISVRYEDTKIRVAIFILMGSMVATVASALL